jgi:hypothetical protein
MKPVAIIAFLILGCYLSSLAQITNVRKWRKSEIDSLDNGLLLFDENNFTQALPIFENILSNHPKEEFLKYTYAKCAFHRSDKHEDAYLYLSEVYAKNKKVPDINYDMALGALYSNKFDEALEYLDIEDNAKRKSPEVRKRNEQLRSYINNAKYYYAKPTRAKITNLGEAVNSPDDELAPCIMADETALVFTYSGPKSIGGKQNSYLSPDEKGIYMNDMYMTYKLESGFTTAFPLDSINTNASDAAISLSNDGRILFVYKDEGDSHGDIYQSFLIGDLYSHPKKLKGQINSFSWEGNCSLSPDGKNLYFSSDRSGGYGGRDIYRATLSADSTWVNVINLGDSVNTPFDDDAPFIHADGATLFFSSKGHTSMGGYDIFKSIMNQKDSTFKNSENLGFPINSTDDDLYFSLAADGTTGYYSSGRKGGKGLSDIYTIETNFDTHKPSVYLVKGKTQFDGEGVAAEIKIEITSKNNKVFTAFNSNSTTGAYLVSLPAGDYYKIQYTYKNKPVQQLLIDALDEQGFVEKLHDVYFDVDTTKLMLASATKTLNSVLSPTVAITAKTMTLATKTPTVLQTPTVSTLAVKTQTKSETKTNTVVAINPVVTQTQVPTLIKTTTLSSQITKTEASVKQTPTVTEVIAAKTTSITKTETKPSIITPTQTVFKATADGFVPKTKLQEKAIRTIEKFGNVTADELEFRVQIAAFKSGKNYAFPELVKFGKIERIFLGDGLTRLYIGGSFKTLRSAFALTKKVVNAGHEDAFVSAFYKGKRLTYDELERQGIFK